MAKQLVGTGPITYQNDARKKTLTLIASRFPDNGLAAQRDQSDVVPAGVQTRLDGGPADVPAAGPDAGGHQPREHGRRRAGGALCHHIHPAVG